MKQFLQAKFFMLSILMVLLMLVVLATGVFAPAAAQTAASTPTPTPLPYRVLSHGNRHNCADIGVNGIVTGPNGAPLGEVTLQYGEVGVPNSRFLATTDFNGRYSGLLLSGSDRAAAQVSHNWYLYVLENGQPLSPVFEFTSNPIFAQNPKRCGSTSDGKQPGCIMDPCRSAQAIQVKTVNWQKSY